MSHAANSAGEHIPGIWETGAPNQGELQTARDASRYLAHYLDHDEKTPLRIRPERNGVVSPYPVSIPYSVARLLERMLMELGHGSALHLFPVAAEFTTQQAANYLRVSRPHVIRLIKEGTLPHRLVGTHRRIRLQDLVKCERDQKNPWLRYLQRDPKPASTSFSDLVSEAESILSSAPNPATPPTPSPGTPPSSNPIPPPAPS